MQTKLRRCLLVEDDDDHAFLVKRALTTNHVADQVDRVSDGEEALAYLRRKGTFTDKLPPDLVLLDLNLPKVSGHEILYQVKNDPVLKSIFIVVLTTSQAEEDQAKANDNGANGYMTKPLDFTKFHQIIGNQQVGRSGCS